MTAVASQRGDRYLIGPGAGTAPGPQGCVQPMSAEIVLAIVVLFFSGVWSAIKFVDEQTDNKWVFLVPAGVLSLFLLSGIGEGFVFFCLPLRSRADCSDANNRRTRPGWAEILFLH